MWKHENTIGTLSWPIPAALAAAALWATAALAAAPASGPEWNQWRGSPSRDAISTDTGLLKAWPEGGPPLLWKVTDLGGGFSGVSFSGNRIFTMGDVGNDCSILALNLADGKTLWAAKVGKTGGGGGYPGPRCTPATDGTLAWALGQYGDLVCVEAATGKERWRKNLPSDFGGKMMSGWGYSESPLLDGDRIVCSPGGSRGTVVALNKETGAVVWQSKELAEPASYSSLATAEIGGARQYIVLTSESVSAVAAADGKLLWHAPRTGKTAVIPTPNYRDNLVFVTSGYGIGCNAFRITAGGGTFKAEPAYSDSKLANHHGGVLLVGDHLYTIVDAGALTCIDFKTGKVAWQNPGVGKGSIAYADGRLIIRSEKAKGTIALVEATPAGYKEAGRFNQPDRSDKNSWPHPVIFQGRMYIRDQGVLLCYDLKAK